MQTGSSASCVLRGSSRQGRDLPGVHLEVLLAAAPQGLGQALAAHAPPHLPLPQQPVDPGGRHPGPAVPQRRPAVVEARAAEHRLLPRGARLGLAGEAFQGLLPLRPGRQRRPHVERLRLLHLRRRWHRGRVRAPRPPPPRGGPGRGRPSPPPPPPGAPPDGAAFPPPPWPRRRRSRPQPGSGGGGGGGAGRRLLVGAGPAGRGWWLAPDLLLGIFLKKCKARLTGVFPEGEQRGRGRRASGEGGRKARRQGVPREDHGPWDRAFPQIYAPARPPGR